MENIDSWSVALLAVAGYLAITSLVRLMIRRREQLLGDFRGRMEAAGRKKPAKVTSPKQPKEETKAA